MFLIYKLFFQLNSYIAKVFTVIVMLLMAWMTLLVAYQVFTRTFLNLPTGWTEEASLDALTWAVFLMAPVVYRSNEILNLDVVYVHFPIKLQKFLNVLFRVLEFAILCVMLHYSIKFMESGKMSFSATLPFISMNYIYMALPIGFAGMLLVCFEHFLSFFVSDEKKQSLISSKEQ